MEYVGGRVGGGVAAVLSVAPRRQQHMLCLGSVKIVGLWERGEDGD